MDEPVNINLSPEEAFRVLFDSMDDPDLPPFGEPFAETEDK